MILLVEEPLSGLEEGDRFQLLRILRAAQGTHSLTIMIATEDADVLAWVDRQIALPVRRRGADGLPVEAGGGGAVGGEASSGGAGDGASVTDGVSGQAGGAAIDGAAGKGAAGSGSGDARGEAHDDTVGVAAHDLNADTAATTATAAHRNRPGIRRAPSSLARW